MSGGVLHHLGFPDFFRVELGIGKIIGGILLIVPQVPHRLKEWAYVGFGISTISAIIGHLAVDDGLEHVYLPLGVLLVLVNVYLQSSFLQGNALDIVCESLINFIIFKKNVRDFIFAVFSSFSSIGIL